MATYAHTEAVCCFQPPSPSSKATSPFLWTAAPNLSGLVVHNKGKARTPQVFKLDWHPPNETGLLQPENPHRAKPAKTTSSQCAPPASPPLSTCPLLIHSTPRPLADGAWPHVCSYSGHILCRKFTHCNNWTQIHLGVNILSFMQTGWGARTPCCSPFLSQSPFTLPPRNDQQSNGSSPLLLRAHCINEPQSLLTTAYACACERQRQRGRGGRGREEEMGSGGREILTLFKAQAPNGVMKILPYIYC